MRAMVLDRQAPIETQPLRLADVPIPEPGEGEIRLRVSVCAICRTDLHVAEGDLLDPKLPLILGHQIVGVVDKVGPGGRSLVGMRAGVAWLRSTDGTCPHCLRGRENLCESARFTGYHEDGGYAEYAIVGENFAYPLPDGLDDAEVSPLLCGGLIGYRALKRAQVPEGGRLLLVGFGSSAHIVIQIAVHRGYRVSVVTRSEGHLELCRRLGAEWAGASFDDLPAKVDSAILFAPAGGLVPPTLRALDRGGVLAVAGVYLSDVPSLSYEEELFYEKEVRSVTANTREDGHELLQEAVEVGVRPQIQIYPLEDANRALIDLKQGRIDGTGVLVVKPVHFMKPPDG